VQRYWNEDYLVVIQHTLSHQFNDIFVWKWDECQNPVRPNKSRVFKPLI
jgi:hypothetical protein